MEIMPISLSSRQPWSSARFLELVWEFFSDHCNFLSCNKNEFSSTHGSVWCNKRLDFWRAGQSSGSTSKRDWGQLLSSSDQSNHFTTFGFFALGNGGSCFKCNRHHANHSNVTSAFRSRRPSRNDDKTRLAIFANTYL